MKYLKNSPIGLKLLKVCVESDWSGLFKISGMKCLKYIIIVWITVTYKLFKLFHKTMKLWNKKRLFKILGKKNCLEIFVVSYLGKNKLWIKL